MEKAQSNNAADAAYGWEDRCFNAETQEKSLPKMGDIIVVLNHIKDFEPLVIGIFNEFTERHVNFSLMFVLTPNERKLCISHYVLCDTLHWRKATDVEVAEFLRTVEASIAAHLGLQLTVEDKVR